MTTQSGAALYSHVARLLREEAGCRAWWSSSYSASGRWRALLVSRGGAEAWLPLPTRHTDLLAIASDPSRRAEVVSAINAALPQRGAA